VPNIPESIWVMKMILLGQMQISCLRVYRKCDIGARRHARSVRFSFHLLCHLGALLYDPTNTITPSPLAPPQASLRLPVWRRSARAEECVQTTVPDGGIRIPLRDPFKENPSWS